MQCVVSDAVAHKPLWPATVVNVFTQQSTSTNEYGAYSIAANAGDIIAFTYIGYKSVEKVQPPSGIAVVNIALEHEDYQLQEFRLHPGHLTQYQIDSIEQRSTYKIPLRQKHANPFNSPFSAIAEKFSKTSKRTFQFQKDFIAGETEKFIDSRYTPELVNKLTGATGDSVGHFMYAYPMPYDFCRTATDLELKMWIRSSYKEWAKNDSVANAAPDKK